MENLKPVIDELFTESQQLNERLKELNDGIESLQKICKHTWVDDGHDSHYRYTKCTICRLTDKS